MLQTAGRVVGRNDAQGLVKNMGWSMGTEAWIWMAVWAVVMVLVVGGLGRGPRPELQADPRRGQAATPRDP